MSGTIEKWSNRVNMYNADGSARMNLDTILALAVRRRPERGRGPTVEIRRRTASTWMLLDL